MMAGETFRLDVANSGQAFELPVDDTILRAGLRAGLDLPYECAVGSCGTCKFQLETGTVIETWPDAPGLSDRDRGRRRFLACQSAATSDCKVRFLSWPHEGSGLRPRRFGARLSKRFELSPNLEQFSFVSDDAANFKSGQFALCNFPGVVGSRAFSMSNLANPEGIWEFVVRKGPGPGTGALFSLRPGDEIEIDGPYGHAYLRETDAKHVVCIAGGSGLAPMLSITRQFATMPRSDTSLHLIYGSRTRCEASAIDRFQNDFASSRSIRVTKVISHENADPKGAEANGFVHEVLDNRLAVPVQDADFYLAGPPPMIDAVLKVLKRMAVTSHRIRYDHFF